MRELVDTCRTPPKRRTHHKGSITIVLIGDERRAEGCGSELVRAVMRVEWRRVDSDEDEVVLPPRVKPTLVSRRAEPRAVPVITWTRSKRRSTTMGEAKGRRLLLISVELTHNL
jgi:hypothetical protein